jgi:hypothetical protein
MQLFVCAGVVTILLLSPLEAAAQSETFESAVTIAEIQRAPALDLNRWTSPPYEKAVAMDTAPPSQTATAPPSKKRTPTRIILGAIVGATAGLFAGGYLGAAIEGDSCHCDDQGLTGALIGAPIGAVVGGVLGGFFLF